MNHKERNYFVGVPILCGIASGILGKPIQAILLIIVAELIDIKYEIRGNK